MNAREISLRLAGQAESVASMLLPGGKREGAEWVAGSVYGEAGKSLKVRLTGEKAGRWCDFADGQHSGDLLDLWAASKGIPFVEAFIEAKRWLGVDDAPRFEGSKPKAYRRPSAPECVPPKGRVLAYLTDERKLSVEALKAFKIRASSADDEILFPFLRGGELLNVKYLKLERLNGKKQLRQEKDAEPALFGWQAVPDSARSVVICEGELDAVTVWQYGFAALSVNSGAGNLQWIEAEFENLERFDEIFLCFDADEAGQKHVAEIAGRLGLERCRIVRLPYKDANECLQHGMDAEAMGELLAAAGTLDPEELRSAAGYVDEVIAEFYGDGGVQAGFVMPWSKTHNTIQLRPAELSIWTGINGHGKSQALGHVMLAAAQQGERVCVFSGEIKPRKLLYRLTRQAAALREPSIPYIRAVHEWFDGQFWLFDVVGTTKSERILEVFRYARKRYGITQFVVDSLMKCGIPEDDYRGQKAFVDALCDFKNELECHVHLVAHARKSDDESRPSGKMDVKGTGAITDLADNVFSVWRNKRKEDGQDDPDAPDAIINCSKQRNGEWEGSVLLWFHPDSFQYLEAASHKPRPFVEFSTVREVAL